MLSRARGTRFLWPPLACLDTWNVVCPPCSLYKSGGEADSVVSAGRETAVSDEQHRWDLGKGQRAPLPNTHVEQGHPIVHRHSIEPGPRTAGHTM